ncbi:MAG: MOP flippase family protein [Pseudomonadota bacterium]
MTTISSVRWVALETFVTKGVALLSFILIARVLGPDVMGIVAVLILVRELAGIMSDFGLSQAIVHYKKPTNSQLATLYSVNWILGFSAFIAGFLFAKPIATLFGMPQLITLLPVVAVGFLLEPIGQQVNALLQKSMDFQVLTKISITTTALGAIISIGGVYSGFGVWAVVISGLISSGARQLAYLAVARRRQLLHGFALDLKQSRALLSFGAYRTGATALNYVNSRADQLIVGGVLGSVALGLYSMATNWTLMAMQQINGIATKVAFPTISKLQDDGPRIRSVYLRLVNRVTTVNAALFFGLAVTAEPLVSLVLGADWSELAPVLQLMCGYVLLRSLGNLNGPLAMGLGKASWAFYWNLGLVAVVPATLWLASKSGSLLFIVMTLIGLQLVFAVLMYLYWTRRLVGPCLKEYAIAISGPWSCGVIMAITIHNALQVFSFLGSALQIGVALLIGGVIYITASWWLNRGGISDMFSLFLRPSQASFFARGEAGK